MEFPNIPAQIRLYIYVIVVMGTAFLVPLNAAHIISDTVILVWTSVAGAASGLASLNIGKK